jgi:hypothetical protein
MPAPPPATEPAYVDRPDLAETFVSGVRLSTFDGHSVYVELVNARPHVTGVNASEVTLYPCARLRMSPMAVAVLHEQLGNLLGVMEKQGILKRLAPSSDQRQ